MNEQAIRKEDVKLEAKSTEITKATKRWEEAKTEWVAIFNKVDTED